MKVILNLRSALPRLFVVRYPDIVLNLEYDLPLKDLLEKLFFVCLLSG